MGRALAILVAVGCSILLAACGSTEQGQHEQPAQESTPSQEVTETSVTELCPSSSEAEHIVTLWSVPLGTMNEAGPEMFNYVFTNALSETVDVLTEDTDSLPCAGQSDLYNTAVAWSDMLEVTADDNRTPTEAELQSVADLGNVWLDTIDATELNFSVHPEPADIGN